MLLEGEVGVLVGLFLLALGETVPVSVEIVEPGARLVVGVRGPVRALVHGTMGQEVPASLEAQHPAAPVLGIAPLSLLRGVDRILVRQERQGAQLEVGVGVQVELLVRDRVMRGVSVVLVVQNCALRSGP